jgi:hypothetical protein
VVGKNPKAAGNVVGNVVVGKTVSLEESLESLEAAAVDELLRQLVMLEQ